MRKRGENRGQERNSNAPKGVWKFTRKLGRLKDVYESVKPLIVGAIQAKWDPVKPLKLSAGKQRRKFFKGDREDGRATPNVLD